MLYLTIYELKMTILHFFCADEVCDIRCICYMYVLHNSKYVCCNFPVDFFGDIN